MSGFRFIVTRPEEDAGTVAHRLESAGHAVIRAPLLAIDRRAGVVIPQRNYRAVLVGSVNGARALAGHPDRQRLAGAAAFAVGPASAAAMRAAGWGAVHAAGGDVAALIAAVRRQLAPADGPLLYVSGETVTGDLERALATSGYAVDRVVLYAAEPVAALPPAAVTGLRDATADAVLLYSPRTAEIWARRPSRPGSAVRRPGCVISACRRMWRRGSARRSPMRRSRWRPGRTRMRWSRSRSTPGNKSWRPCAKRHR